MQAPTELILPLPSIGRGKIRRIYDTSQYVPETLLIWTSDLMSAFDRVMATAIPGKGIVLNTVSAWWFEKTKHICPNHFITDNFDELPPGLQELLAQHRSALEGRFMLVRKATPLKAELIVRRYLLGSAWESYQKTGMVCGIKLPPGLEKGARLEEPIFTPSTKAPEGEHDVNITYKELEELIGNELAAQVKAYCLALFEYAEGIAIQKGLTLKDTKFEFALLPDGTLILIDELFTPDNSRWDPDTTKQPFRDTLKVRGLDKVENPLILGVPLVTQTTRNYAKAYHIITGKVLVS